MKGVIIMKEKVIVLCSGGFDSVVLMHRVVKELKKDVVALFFDYGQRNVSFEREKSIKVCEKLKAEFKEIRIPTFNWSNSSLYNENISIDAEGQYLPMRNMVFLSYATSLAQSLCIKEVYCAFIPMPEGTYYPDTSPDFLTLFNSVSHLAGVKVIAPFLDENLSKEGLSYEARIYNISESDFFSCNTPVFKGLLNIHNSHCGKCGDCLAIQDIYNNYINPYIVEDQLILNNFEINDEVKQAIRNSPILYVKLFINNSCQFSCKHCLYGFKEMSGKEMTFNDYCICIDGLVELGVIYIDFVGKEPLYDEKVFNIMEYIKNNHPNLKYGLITNGVNVEKYIDKIVDNLKCITLSVESLGTVKSRNSNAGFIKNITLLREKGVNVSVSIDLHKNNKDEIQSIVKELETYGVCEYYIKPIVPLGLGKKYVNSDMITPEESFEVMKSFYDHKYSGQVVFEMKQDFTYSLMQSSSDFRELMSGEAPILREHRGVFLDFEYICSSFVNSIAITADGCLLGCGMAISNSEYEKYSAGDVREVSLSSAILKAKESRLNTMTLETKSCYFIKE